SGCCSPLICLSARFFSTPSPVSSGIPPAVASSSPACRSTPSTSVMLFLYSNLLSRAARPVRLNTVGFVEPDAPPDPGEPPELDAPPELAEPPEPDDPPDEDPEEPDDPPELDDPP